MRKTIVQWIAAFCLILLFPVASAHAQFAPGVKDATGSLFPVVVRSDARFLSGATLLPKTVRKVFTWSVVGVFVYTGHATKTLDFSHCGTGFFVGPKTVLTRYHIALPNGILTNQAAQHLKVLVESNNLLYQAKIVYFEADTDLLLLSVPQADGMPAAISDVPMKKGHEDLFTFGFTDFFSVYYANHDAFYGYSPNYALQLNGDSLSGLLHRKVQGGFSGSPVIDTTGKVRGDVWGERIYQSETIFTSAKTMLGFLARAKAAAQTIERYHHEAALR